MDLSIMIPCRREAANIASCLQRVLKICPQAEILVIDSGLDETREIVESFTKNATSLRYILCKPDRGKGDAIRQGIAAASSSLLLQIDADLQFLPEEIPQLIQPILEGKADMTLGSRFLQSSQREVDTPLLRSSGNFLISLWCSILFQQRIRDVLTGLKAWRREVTESFPITSSHFSYEVELIANAIQQGFKVLEVAVHYETRKKGESKVPLLKTAGLILYDSLRFKYSRK